MQANARPSGIHSLEEAKLKLRKIAALATLLAIAATACADEGGGGAGSGGIAHATGGTDLILRIETGGGFVPVEYNLTQIPGFSLYGDGRLIRTGAQIEIYPGPALPPLTQAQLTEKGVQAILGAADEAGLLNGDINLGFDLVADAPTTTITVGAGGDTHTASVYALGLEGGEKPQGMSQSDWEARQAIYNFSLLTGDLSWLPNGSIGEETPFSTDELRIFVRDYQRDPSLHQEAVDWPGQDLAVFGSEVSNLEGWRCGSVTGDDLEAVMALATAANQLTPWDSGAQRYGLLFRPLLPDESGC